ncbi:Spherulation-specific family 4-domain-containing protein [Elsinoe ampelina]|uniref:Spherulation-specific family 4-domain-containing protein n=1 Tax=Elsinoe ampelina TaxID=302913 RepID=A0A6A6GCD8_9PEZI|nr:Spherulation-specific family 4-domain-containing protein [Elsinoe ampelina]
MQDLVATPDTGSGDNEGSSGQQIAVASYTNPLGDPAAWSRLISYDTNKVSVLVANVLNGPDYIVDSSWASVIQQAAASGKTVIGYVRTGYLGVSQQRFKTRLGSSNLADWASQIEQDVDKWFELYPGGISGIFFDEGWPECGPNNIYSDLYAHINAYTKRKHPGAYTVLNPGSPMAQCFEDTMDTLLTFESSYETYTTSFVPNDWTPKDDRKIWHIIYRVPQDKIEEVATLARSRHAGYVEITDDDNPNPYDNVPSDAYMQAVMATVQGGNVGIAVPKELGGSYVAGLPGDTTITASDYTSVTIVWSPVANALGYAVYQNSQLVLEMPATLTRATIGMLQPGSAGLIFEVRTVLSSGASGTSRTVSGTTKKLDSGGSITNVKYTRSGDTVIYTADVLVPYAFVRLFIVGPAVGWPIDAGINADTGMGQWKLANYLVEGNDFYSGFYKYSGSWIEAGTSNADWTWTPQGTAPQTQSGYTYTWNVPIGGTDAVLDDYAIQGQGYASISNVFGGSLRSYKCDGDPCDDNPDYDCKGSTLCWTPNLLKWCDLAVNNLSRTDALSYATFGGQKTGNCWGDGASSGCGVFIQGSNCQISGNDIWHDYQNIRDLGGCKRCGSYYREDGCRVAIDFVSTCDLNTGGTLF